jgi:hypothetical protein
MPSLGFLRIKKIDHIKPDRCELELEIGPEAHTDSPDIQSLGLDDIHFIPSENGTSWRVAGKGKFAGKVGEGVRLSNGEDPVLSESQAKTFFLFAVKCQIEIPEDPDADPLRQFIVEVGRDALVRREGRERALECRRARRTAISEVRRRFSLGEGRGPKMRLLSVTDRRSQPAGKKSLVRENVRIWEF